MEKLIPVTLRVLRKLGLLLVSQPEGKKPNVMTIGWGMTGIIWGKPMFLVAVRPSRYTFELIEKACDFTVNVPSKGMEKIVNYCGSVSGRDYDKFSKCQPTALASKRITSPIIKECIIHYECKVVYKTDLNERNLPTQIISQWYPHGDLHRLYVGEIVEAYADEDYTEKLP